MIGRWEKGIENLELGVEPHSAILNNFKQH